MAYSKFGFSLNLILVNIQESKFFVAKCLKVHCELKYFCQIWATYCIGWHIVINIIVHSFYCAIVLWCLPFFIIKVFIYLRKLRVNYRPASEARRGVYWNQEQKNFTHPYTFFLQKWPLLKVNLKKLWPKFFQNQPLLGRLAATHFYKWPI